MRRLTYNILCGGIDRVAGTNRLDDILQLVRDLNPDELALQKANGFHDDRLLSRFAEDLALPHSALSVGSLYDDGERYHAVVLSRYPMSSTHTFPEGHSQSAAISVEVDTPIGPISICSLHLHAYSEDERLRELGHILEYQRRYHDQVILGDFNSICRTDSGAYSDNSEFEIRFDLADRLTSEFVDVFYQFPGSTRPTDPTGLPADDTCIIQRRIDYVFASPEIGKLVRSARVVDDPLAHRASDHFPLFVEFEGQSLAVPADEVRR